MAAIDQLASPYIQELPLELLPEAVQYALSHVNARTWRVLLDILHHRVYLAEQTLVSELLFQDIRCEEYRSAYRYSRYCGIEVEINSHCNLRCSFCPVSFAPHPQKLMSLDQFRHVVGQAASCGMKEISLNHYSEPTLHPLLEEIVKSAIAVSLTVTLFTNGTALSRNLVDSLSPFRDVIAVVVNVASSNQDEYYRVTKRSLLKKVLTNVRYAAQKLRVEVVINNGDEQSKIKMQNVVPCIPITLWRTDDRAGLVDTKGVQSQNHSGLLNGCPLAIRYVNISVDGDVFLCPQDYWKAHVMGNIYKESLEAILESEKAWQLRRWIFGIEKAPDDWICRRCSWTTERKALFSVGAPLSDVDMRVYGDVLHRSAPTLIWLDNGNLYSRHCKTWEEFRAEACLP